MWNEPPPFGARARDGNQCPSVSVESNRLQRNNK